MAHSIRFRLALGYFVVLALLALALLTLGRGGGEDLRDVVYRIVVLLTVGAGCALMSMRLLWATLQRPLDRLNEALRAMRSGDFMQISAGQMPTELLPLAESYNAVSAVLGAHQRELHEQLRRTALLTRLSIELRESLDTPMIVQDILQAIGSNTDADRASVLLISPTGSVEHAAVIVAGQLQPIPAEQAQRLIEQGIQGWVLRHSCSVVIPDVTKDDRWLQLGAERLVGSAIALPITHARSTLGVLLIMHDDREHFTGQDLLLLEGVAAQAGVAVVSAQRHALEQRRREQALLLFSMSQALTVEKRVGDLATELLQKSTTVFDACHTALFLGSAGAGTPTLFMERGELPRAQFGAQLTEIAWRVWRSKEALSGGLAQPTVSDEQPAGSALQRVYVALPLLHNGDMIGIFVLVRNASGTAIFSADLWSVLTTFTNVAAAAFANLQLVERLQMRAETLEQQVNERTGQLQHSRDLLRIVFDNLPDGLVLLDTQERVLAANSNFCRCVLGRRPEVVVGKLYSEIIADLQQRDSITFAPFGIQDRAQRVVCTDIMGQQRFYDIERLAIVAGAAGGEQRLERWSDVTSEEDLQRKLLLHEQLTTLGRLAASVAHELGNPLQAVRGSLDLCRESLAEPSSLVEYLTLADGELDRMAQLLDRLRYLYHAPQVEWQQVDLNLLVGEVQRIVGKQLSRRKVDLLLELDPEVPSVRVQPDALRQVLLNLMLNAQEAITGGGSITVVSGTDADQRECWLSISDTGEGIAPERLGSLFEPFRSGKQGLGLGLYLSKQLVQRHGGRIEVASTVGVGTTVEVVLPLS